MSEKILTHHTEPANVKLDLKARDRIQRSSRSRPQRLRLADPNWKTQP